MCDTSPPLVLDIETWVANLFDDSLGEWNTRIIDEQFLPFEDRSIKSIPLCISSQQDYLHWPLERNGSYSMKSDYKLLCVDSSRGEASSSNSATDMVFWFGIWKLKMPRKVKHFLWRPCTNSLPTKVNLMSKKFLLIHCVTAMGNNLRISCMLCGVVSRLNMSNVMSLVGLMNLKLCRDRLLI